MREVQFSTFSLIRELVEIWRFWCLFYCHILQRVREAVKNTGRWTKQAFLRLETRVLRPDKEKFQVEPGVKGQEGEGGERGKWRPHPPPEEDVREQYLSSLSQH